MLLNPGKGWVQYYGTDKYTKDYISVGYTRWPWSVLEPEEGRFNWKAIDDFIRMFKEYGKKTAFGVMSVSTGLGQFVTPKWVFDAGAVPHWRFRTAHRPRASRSFRRPGTMQSFSGSSQLSFVPWEWATRRPSRHCFH